MSDLVKTPTKPIDLAAVVKTYNGLTGCACGCGGNYAYPTDSTEASAEWGERNDNKVKARVRAINADLGSVELYVWDDEACYEIRNADDTRCTRVYVTWQKGQEA